MEEIPQWAKERAAQICNAEGHAFWKATVDNICDAFSGRAFARYIAEHEEPPVDPLIEVREEIVSRYVYTYQGLRLAVDEALRRGMELAKSETSNA